MEVDLLVIVVLAAGAHFGHLRGLLRSGGDLLSLVLGLFLTALIYPVGAWLLRLLGMAHTAAEVGGFVLTVVAVVFGSNALITYLAERRELHPRYDKLGGLGAGVVNAGVLLAAFLPFCAAIPQAAPPLARSVLAKPFMAGVPWAMGAADRIGFPLPKMIMLPTRFELEGTPQMRQGLQLLRINFARLEGSTCIACRGRMRFLGYQRRFPPAISPKLRCEQCGRTTDGCQSFQGMHMLYNECPVNVARKGGYLDCGVWSNHKPVLPLGRCPVCGRELPSGWQPPATGSDPDPLESGDD